MTRLFNRVLSGILRWFPLGIKFRSSFFLFCDIQYYIWVKQPLEWEKNLGRDLILSIIKGTVQPKIKIVSSFSHPHVVPNLYKFLSYVEHKRRYSEEFCRTKHLLVPIDFHSREINQWGPSTVWLPAFFKIYFYAQYKKETIFIYL